MKIDILVIYSLFGMSLLISCKSTSSSEAFSDVGGREIEWHFSCQSYMKEALSKVARDSDEAEGMRWNTKPVSWRECVERYQAGIDGPDPEAWHPSCEWYMKDALRKVSRDSAEADGMRWNTKPVSWRACVDKYQGKDVPPDGEWHASCQPYMKEALSKVTRDSDEAEGMRWNTDPVSWRACVETYQGKDAPSDGEWHASCQPYMKEALSKVARDSNEAEGMRWNTKPVSWRACVEAYQGVSQNPIVKKPDQQVICIFDYDLTLSSHRCSETQGKKEYHCSNVVETYGWRDQCLAVAAAEAIRTCIDRKAKLAVASHSWYDRRKLDAIRKVGWPADAKVIMDRRKKQYMIDEIRAYYGMPNAHVIFWDDTYGNIRDVSSRHRVHTVQIKRGDPRGSGNCGIRKSDIENGWDKVN